MRSKKQAFRLVMSAFAIIIFALGLGAKMMNEIMRHPLLEIIPVFLWLVSGVVFFFLILGFLMEHQFYEGFRYFWNHWQITNKLERQMIDAGFGIQRSYYIELPKIQLYFNNNFRLGVLKIKNALKFDKRLDDVVMSSALGKYIVERHYLTDDGNFYIYELVDGSLSFKQNFDSFDAFQKYSRTIPPYELFLDNRSTVKLQHTLLVGMTGSGKTYGLYSLVLQMLNKDIPYKLYFADPKGSGVAVMGSDIAEDRTAVDFARIIELLEEFVEEMKERKDKFRKKLESNLDSDYSSFGFPPIIFICDEYASFASVLATEDKKTRDKVNSLLHQIVLQGRQLGCFLFLVMQKSDASLIDTALRENIPLKIVLGNSENQTYVTAFGAGVDIPNRHYKVGEGVFTEPELAPEPKLVQFPFCNFDILKAIRRAPVM